MAGRPPVRTLRQSQGMAMSKVDNDFLSPLDAAFSHKCDCGGRTRRTFCEYGIDVSDIIGNELNKHTRPAD